MTRQPTPHELSLGPAATQAAERFYKAYIAALDAQTATVEAWEDDDGDDYEPWEDDDGDDYEPWGYGPGDGEGVLREREENAR